MPFFKREFTEWSRALLRAIPGKTGEALRRSCYGFRCDKTSRVLSNTIVYYPENLTLGSNTAISTFCQLNAHAGITIGNDVLIGPGTMIWSQNHNMADANQLIRKQGYTRKSVVIEDDVWIAARCVVLPGVHLAKGTVVAAGAVVTRSTEPYAIVAGVPARPIGQREHSPSDSSDNLRE